MGSDVAEYISKQTETDKEICERLQIEISQLLLEAENKVWHAHPVWFLDGNPIVGYSKRKAGVQLMFWSGVDFDEPGLQLGSGKFKDASITYQTVDDIDSDDLERWLEKSKHIQWDYKNIVKHKGKLERLNVT